MSVVVYSGTKVIKLNEADSDGRWIIGILSTPPLHSKSSNDYTGVYTENRKELGVHFCAKLV